MNTDWPTRLRAAGLRVTRPRLTVLRVVEATPHIAADVVAQHSRAELGAVSTQAVYDVLNVLTDHAILRRFEPAGSAMRYEAQTGDNHHHLVCRSCGTVSDVPCAVGSMPCDIPAETGGFSVDEAEVTYWGRCAACQAASQDAPA